MNYIGSKYSLIEKISSLIAEKVPLEGKALDLFSGTTTVAQQLKILGFETYANDWQYYSFITANSYLTYNTYPSFERLLKQTKIQEAYEQSLTEKKDLFGKSTMSFMVHSVQNRSKSSEDAAVFSVLWYLQNLQGKKGKFYHEYCEGGNKGRLYYSKENGLKIQAIGAQINEWNKEGLLSEDEHFWLRASLVESADRVANTASVYGAYLKKIKKTAAKSLEMVALSPVVSPNAELQHKAFCGDASTLFLNEELPEMNLIYLDPPYNGRQYSGNYHILETLARWDIDTFEPKGITGQRDTSSQSSPFCSKNKVYAAFDALFSTLKSKFILFSYNNEGLLSEEQLRTLFSKYCTKTDFFTLEYGRFRADNDSKNRQYSGDTVQEFLILGQMKRTEKSTTDIVSMEKSQVQKIFANKQNAADFVQDKFPHTFIKKPRAKTAKYCEETYGDIYQFIIDKACITDIRDRIFDIITGKEGKFHTIHSNPKKANARLQDLLKECKRLKKSLQIKEAVCMPDAFSDQVVKPEMRKALATLETVKKQAPRVQRVKNLAELHFWERELAQLRGDLAEYSLLIQAKEYLIPTLKHQCGTDFYLIEDNKIADLDIKTSKWPTFFDDGISPEEAIKLLYERQGADRFSKEPRLYLVKPSESGKKVKCSLSLKDQLFRKYNIKFSYRLNKSTKTYDVTGCRIIFLDL